MDFIQFMKQNGINYRDRRGIAPYDNGERKMKISAIAIHHSGANVDQSSKILEGYWGGTLGWGTGGYHVVIRRNAEATVEWNYDSARISNGVGNHNGYIFNISVEGSSNFTDRQNEVLKLVTRFWKDQLGLPYTAILGHNEFSGHYTNTCPGRNMATFRAQVNAMPAADQIHAQTKPVGVTFSGQAHVQSKGWVEMSNNTLGTVGQGLRLEAFSLVVKNNGKDQPLNGSIHVQDIGNVEYNQNTNLFGTVGQAKRIEAILINVGNGVQYRAHTANIGWGPWVKSGEWAGTKEMGLQIEAIEFRVA